MKKKILSIMLTGALMITSFAPLALSSSEVYGAAITDINEHWAKSYILKAAERGIVTGYDNGTFLPDQPVTRAEFVTMINKVLGNESTGTVSFKDVPAIEWYYSNVSKAIAAQYVSGYDDNTFLPNGFITRQEAAVILSRIVPTYGYSGNISTYKDYSQIGEWAIESLKKVNAKGYIGAYDDGLLHPLDSLTRAQTAKIICDIMDKENIVKALQNVKTDDTKLSGKIYSNGITINKNLDDGNATIDNCVVLGSLYIQGGGTNTVTINNSRIASCNVSKTASQVGVLAKGETNVIETNLWNDSILKTKNLTSGVFGPGFSNINVRQSAVAHFDGNFPLITIAGPDSYTTLEAGTIAVVDILTAAKNSEITLDTYGTVTTANVNAISSFKGSGTLKTMNANISGITYETKPLSIRAASGITAPKYVDADLSISCSPSRGSSDISVDTSIKLSFSTPLTKYNGNNIADSDLRNLITLKSGSSSGSNVTFDASINAAKKIITITPSNTLSYDTKYYVGINANSFKDTDGNGNDSFSTYFTTTSSYPVISSITASSNENTITVSVTPNRSGTLYGVLVSNNIAAPSASQIIAGKDGNGSAATRATGAVSVNSNSSKTLSSFNGLSSNTTYVFYCVLKTNSDTSAVKYKSVATNSPSIPVASLTSLTATVGGDNKLTSFGSSTTSYDVAVPFGTTQVLLTATGNGTISFDNGNTYVANNHYTTVSLSNHRATATVIIQKNGSNSTTYTVNIKESGNTAVANVAVSAGNGSVVSLAGGSSYILPSGSTSANIVITTDAADAVINCNQLSVSSGTHTINGVVGVNPTGITTVTYTVTSLGDTKTYVFTLQLAD